MTRFLSQALQAPEPLFRQGLQRLEAANGHPNTDIRFSNEISHATRLKLQQLGLDPNDTTPEELYHALQERLKTDDTKLVRTLRTHAATYISADGDVVAGMRHILGDMLKDQHCFALKTSRLKSLIKKIPPKKSMRRLGYRSLDSCLKHEAPVALLAAAWLSEGSTWQHRFLEQYKQLQPSDFEERHIALIQLSARHYERLSLALGEIRHNLLSFKECGALVFLPLPSQAPVGSTTACLSLALTELNGIRASSSFLKLAQVRPDFGRLVQAVATDEPRLHSQMLDQPVPWQLIHRSFARLHHLLNEDVFEPHLRLEDMAWQPIEKVLSAIEPSFAFWQHSNHLAVLHDDQKPVSLNLLDTALNCCNQLPFERRVSHYLQLSLWHELLLRYLRPEAVEQAVLGAAQPALAEELAVA